MAVITRWGDFQEACHLGVVEVRCCCCKGTFIGWKNHLKKVLARCNSEGSVMCLSCGAARNLQQRHTNPPTNSQVSQLMRETLDRQGGKCAITGQPLQWGFNCSPDHIVSVGGGMSGKKSPWGPDNLQIVSIAANMLKGDLTMEQVDHLLNALRGECDLINPRIRFSSGGTQSARLAQSARLSTKRRSAKGRTGMSVEIDNQWIRDMWRSNPFCHWSGLPLPGQDVTGLLFPVSLDRLSDHEGYTEGNTVLCLSPFNMMRSTGSSHVVGSGMTPEQTRLYVGALRSGSWDPYTVATHPHYTIE